jgi:drug/metabolite transporter (DMT)-like permease
MLAAAATAGWASLGLLGKLAFALGIGPQALVTLRVIMAVAILTVILSLTDRPALQLPRSSLPLFLALGAAVALNYSMFFHGVAILSVGVSISIFYLYPIFVTIAAFFFLKEPLSWEKGVALAVAIVGTSLVSGMWESAISLSAVGIAFVLAAAVGCAAYTLLVKAALHEHPPARVLFYSLTFSLPLLLMATFLTHEKLIAPYPVAAWGIILLLALFPTLLGYYLFTLALERIEAGRASIIGTLEPVLASLLAFIFLKERLTPLQGVGIIFILLGAGLAQHKRVEPGMSDELPLTGEEASK